MAIKCFLRALTKAFYLGRYGGEGQNIGVTWKRERRENTKVTLYGGLCQKPKMNWVVYRSIDM